MKMGKDRTPNFVAVGHFTHDVTPHGYIIGGSAAYSSITVCNIGLRSRVVTFVGSDFDQNAPLLNGIEVNFQISEFTTEFNNIYENGYRHQLLLNVADRICAKHIPLEWRNAEIAYICPVADEVAADVVHAFPNAVIGVTPQGWMRRWDESHRVSAKKWENPEMILPYVDALILSVDDIADFPDELDRYIELTKIVVLTKNKKGATLYEGSKSIDFPAYKTTEVDQTGAGDVFAAAFLSQYYETRNASQATDFANCVASFAVEGEGTKAIPILEQIERRFNNGVGLYGKRHGATS